MIKGFLLAISISVFVTSFIFLLAGEFEALNENLLTGAFIGPSELSSYTLPGVIVGLIFSLTIILILRRKIKRDLSSNLE